MSSEEGKSDVQNGEAVFVFILFLKHLRGGHFEKASSTQNWKPATPINLLTSPRCQSPFCSSAVQERSAVRGCVRQTKTAFYSSNVTKKFLLRPKLAQLCCGPSQHAHCVPNQKLQAFIFLCGEVERGSKASASCQSTALVPQPHVFKAARLRMRLTTHRTYSGIMCSKKIQNHKDVFMHI